MGLEARYYRGGRGFARAPASSQVVFEASGLFGAAFAGDVADFVATVGAFFVGFDRRAKRQGVCAGSGHV